MPKFAPPPKAPEVKRLNQWLAECTSMSRRKADTLIEQGAVKVNGQPAALGQKVDPHKDVILYDGKRIQPTPQSTHKQYVLFYKPAGVVTTKSDPEGRRTLYDVLPEELKHLKPAGRLDRQTSGLIILTNDGAFLQRISHPSHALSKTYRVTVNKPFTKESLKTLETGVFFEEEQALAKGRVVEWHLPKKIDLQLTTGMNRQVRRMIEAVGLEVKTLKRVAIGNLTIGNLRPGQSRPLSLRERNQLLK